MANPINPNVAALTGGTYMRTKRRQVPYVMLHRGGQGYKEKIGPGTANSGYFVLVDWAQANTFIVDVMGEHKQASPTTISRFDPEPHAFWPGLYCLDCELIESLGVVVSDADVLGALSYDYAVYYLTFGPVTWNLATDDAALRNGEISRYVTRPPNKLVGEAIQMTAQLIFPFLADNVTPDPTPQVIATPPTYKNSYTEFTLIQEYVPSPITNILTKSKNFMNCVNAVPFGTVDDLPMTIGTVLYLGMGERERLPFSSTGTVLWRIPHLFVFRPQGWNTALRLSTAAPTGGVPAQWAPVLAKATYGASTGSTWPPYPSTFNSQGIDLGRLFEIGPT